MSGGNTIDETESINIEAVRAEATDALARFTPEDRKFATDIGVKNINLLDLADDWSTKLKDLFEELEATSSQPKIRTYLAKHFSFTEKDVEPVIDGIIETRQLQALEATISKRFRDAGFDHSEPHIRLVDFLLLEPIGIIDAFFDRARAYYGALKAADDHNITLCDPHGSWLERQRAAMQIQKERSAMAQSETDRLQDIAEEISRIQDDRDSTISRVIAMDWDYPRVLVLHDKYRDQVAKLKKADRENPTKIIRIFEKVTKDFRENQTERLTKRTHTRSLKGIRDIQEGIYDLLLELFDLSDNQRAHIDKQVKSYTSLRQERDMILLLQRNREHFLSQN